MRLQIHTQEISFAGALSRCRQVTSWSAPRLTNTLARVDRVARRPIALGQADALRSHRTGCSSLTCNDPAEGKSVNSALVNVLAVRSRASVPQQSVRDVTRSCQQRSNARYFRIKVRVAHWSATNQNADHDGGIEQYPAEAGKVDGFVVLAQAVDEP